MNYLSLLFLLFSQFVFLLLPFANGAQIMVEIEPNWMPLPEYSSLLEPEEFRELFQSKRFELQIYKEGIQEGISIAGTRVINDRDVFKFENIPEDWMEPTGVVLEIKLPPILSVNKILLSEESFYHPRIRRPFRILRNRNNLPIYRFTILENPERIFRTDIQLPMMETPKAGNVVAYMESLNNSVTKLEQSEQLCAQTKYECNLNLLLKCTHVERQFVAFLKAATKRTLTVSTQNFATIKAKSDKLFNDIMKLAVGLLEEEKKLFKENASSSIDLYDSSPTVPTPILQHLPSRHQHGLNSSQSSHTQTPTSGASSSAAAAAAVLPINWKIIVKLMPIERIAQVLAGLHPSRTSQPSQINFPAGTNQERMQQREVGQTSHGPSAGQMQEKGKEKVANVVEPATNVEEISSSEENDPRNPMGPEQMQSSETKTKSTDEPRRIGDPEDIWASDHDPSDRAVHGDKRIAEEQLERFALTYELGLKRRQTYRWFINKKSLLKTSVKIRQEFESEKKKYQAEMAANASAPTAANRINYINEKANFDKHQRAALWRHFVKFEEVLFTQSADEVRQKEEEKDRTKLANSTKLNWRQIYNTKTRLKDQEKTRREYDSEKNKYQSEMAATGGDNASASASAFKVPSTAANEKISNVEVISSNEETDQNPLAIVPAEPIDSIDVRPLNWRPPTDDKKGQKRKHSSDSVAAGDEKRAKPNQGTSASAPAELPSPAVDLNLNLNEGNPEEEEQNERR